METREPLSSATAVVLTFRRPRLATKVVEGLVDVEGFAPASVVLVINGEGGLDDATLQESITVVKLAKNLGPAGGYDRGLRFAYEHTDADWFYICEDDVGLFEIPLPRVARLISRLAEYARTNSGLPVGGVVAYGRDLDRRTGITVPHKVSGATYFEDVDVAAWGASLLSRKVLDAGIFPDDEWFFGFEDFDFWLRARSAGFRLVVDVEAARAVENLAFGEGRTQAHRQHRVPEEEEGWRQYYGTRNFFELRRRHGHAGWTVFHLLKTLRRLQLAPGSAARRAIRAGIRDGFLGRVGEHPEFGRSPDDGSV